MKEKNKIQYLKIKTKDVKRYIGYYENWYNTFDKDGYKYVIEQLSCDHNIDDKYYNNVLSSLHNFIKNEKSQFRHNQRKRKVVAPIQLAIPITQSSSLQ